MRMPGKPAESLLLKAVRFEDLEMPPGGKLPDSVIADLDTVLEAISGRAGTTVA